MTWNALTSSLDLTRLPTLLRRGEISARDVAEAVSLRIERCDDQAIWISRVSQAQLLARASGLDAQAAEQGFAALPLFGIPFAVKDNMDVQAMRTTAACPVFSYTASQTAHVVQRLLDAGALLVGKTNLDQFATGLVGTRSPYGVPRNPFSPSALPGGSSSGSAVAVARGLVSFALGTDTAGSGRVPAALNNVVGLKPSRGLMSCHGIVPACRSLDCVSIFALTARDSVQVARVAAGFDSRDAFARPQAVTQLWSIDSPPGSFRFAVPRPAELEFFGDRASARCFQVALEQLAALGGSPVEIDFQVFREAAALLYEGPWVAERLEAVGDLLATKPEALHADVREAIAPATRFSARDGFTAYHRLKTLRRAAYELLTTVDTLVVPSVGCSFSLAEALSTPQKVNRSLGYYTNFVNLLDLCAVAVPATMRDDGVPFGVTLIGPAFSDSRLASLAQALQRRSGLTLGATRATFPPEEASSVTATPSARVRVCVVGAHLSGLPLNHQLLERRASLVCATRTAPRYRLYALEHFTPPRPGMLRAEHGREIAVEVWELPTEEFGGFVKTIPAPLSIGQVELMSGEHVCGFLCESYALADGRDITEFGGWRAYLAARSQ